MSAKIRAAGFHELWEKYAPDVFRFSLYLSGTRETAEDLTSEAFLRLWSARDRVEALTVKSYLLSIARNLYLHQLRRARRERFLSDMEPAGIELTSPSPVAAAENREELRAVLRATAQLPEVDRSALLLRVGHELPYEEIAAILGIPVSTAKVKVHRARLRLAELTQRSSVS